jgi:Alkyl sulfatase dimerisation
LLGEALRRSEQMLGCRPDDSTGGPTTELYQIPPTSVWQDIVELAGGTAALTGRARAHAAQGRTLQALHLTGIVLAGAPSDSAALQVKNLALDGRSQISGHENFSEVQWLEQAIKSAGTSEVSETQ